MGGGSLPIRAAADAVNGALVSFVAALLAFVVLDGLWLGVVMSAFYRDQLGPLARMSAGSLAPIWWAAGLVYVLLAGGTAGLVVSRSATPELAAVWGAFFGLIVYGVYDLTNLATLRNWPPLMTIVDMFWGTAACAGAGWFASVASRWWR